MSKAEINKAGKKFMRELPFMPRAKQIKILKKINAEAVVPVKKGGLPFWIFPIVLPIIWDLIKPKGRGKIDYRKTATTGEGWLSAIYGLIGKIIINPLLKKAILKLVGRGTVLPGAGKFKRKVLWTDPKTGKKYYSGLAPLPKNIIDNFKRIAKHERKRKVLWTNPKTGEKYYAGLAPLPKNIMERFRRTPIKRGGGSSNSTSLLAAYTDIKAGM